MIFVALAALGALALASIRRIPEGQVYTLRRLGGHLRVVHSGMHFMLPIVERVAHKISLTGDKVAIDGLAAAGQDYRGIVYFQVLDPERADRVIDDVDALLEARTRSLIADAGLPEAGDARRVWLKNALNAGVRDRGLLVTRVDLNAIG